MNHLSPRASWDVAFPAAKAKENGRRQLQITVPSELAGPLVERGYDRCAIYITDEGILFRPYLSSKGEAPKIQVVALPEWS